jgi:DNA polymerase-3 subunit gamma/tau
MLTKEAFNALLKTLEEPPPDTVFIFATTEFHKVLATIVSRCQHFEFKKVSPVELIAHLRDVAAKEKLTITPFGLGLIAAAADGSVRDAQSLLDQAVAFCGTTIGDVEIKEILGAVSGELLFEFSSAVAEARAGDIFALVEKIIEAGHDPRYFYKEFIEHVRGLLLVRTVEKPQELLLFAAQDLERLKTEAEKASAEDWLRWLQALQAAEGGLKFASHPQIYFETVLVRLCHFGRIVPIQDLLQEVAELKKSTGAADDDRRGPAGPDPAARPAPKFSLSRPPAPPAEAKAPAPRPADPPARTASGPEPAAPRRTDPGAPAERTRRQEAEREQALKDPGVRRVVERLKGQVLGVEKTGAGRDEPEE